MKNLVMVVYNTLATDARVRRSSKALADEYNLTLIGLDGDPKCDKYKYINLSLTYQKSVFRYIEFIRKIKKILYRIDFDVFYGNDYFCSGLCSWVKRKWPKKTVIYDAHELYIPTKDNKLDKRAWYFYEMEKRAILKSNLIICANQERADIMRTHYGLKNTPTPIRNISSLPIIDNDKAQELLSNISSFMDIEGTTLVYAGVLATTRKIEKLIEVVEKNKYSSKLLIIGNGAAKDSLLKLANDTIPGRFHFCGEVSYEYLGCLLQCCDVGYLYYPLEDLNNIYCAPNKLYEYTSVLLPIMANNNPTISKIVSEANIGIANDDFVQSFENIQANIDKYKANCAQFNNVNQWIDEAARLRSAVLHATIDS